MHDAITISKLSFDDWFEEVRAYMESIDNNEEYFFRRLTLMDLYYTMRWPVLLKSSFNHSNKIPNHYANFIKKQMIEEEIMVYQFLKERYMIKHNNYRAERDLCIAEFYLYEVHYNGEYWRPIYNKLFKYTGRERN